MEKTRIGIDIGNVIIGGAGADTSFFSDDFLLTPEVSGAFDAIAALTVHYDVWLLSKCGQKVQDKTLIWLSKHLFFEQTGVDPQQVLFCRQRSEKAGIAQGLGLSVFIDDRLDIISSMDGMVDHPLLFESWEQIRQNPVLDFSSRVLP